MNMILTNHSFQDVHIQHIAGLPKQVPTTQLCIAHQYVVPVFSAPHQMYLQMMN